MMKIGLITFHRAINNGAVLQAYALSKALNGMGVEAEYIDYTAKAISDSYSITPLFKRRNIKSILLYFLCDRNVLKMQDKFYAFVEKYLPVSKPIFSKNIEGDLEQYDILMSGGDQIWNLELTGGDRIYFWDTTNEKRRVSYGSSLGKLNFPETQKESVARMLSKFDSINVREERAKDVIDSLIKTECTVVPDPVFLLSKEEWIDSFDLKEKNGNYILFFELHKNPTMQEKARLLSKEKGLPILRISNDFRHYERMKNIKRTAPLEFMGLILNASYIVTDSFHASAISLIFGKQLYIGLKTGKLAGLNTRIDSLVKTFGIEKQLVREDSSFEKIDYSSVNEQLKKQREFGLRRLKEIIG